MQLRDYQKQAVSDIFSARNGSAQNVLYVLPTGGGKTSHAAIFSAQNVLYVLPTGGGKTVHATTLLPKTGNSRHI